MSSNGLKSPTGYNSANVLPSGLGTKLNQNVKSQDKFVVYMWQCLVHSRLRFNCQDAAIHNYVAKKVRLAQNWASQS